MRTWHSLDVAIAFIALMLSTKAAPALDLELYYPLNSGEFSTFTVNSSYNETQTVLATSPFVNGTQVRIVRTTGGEEDGYESYETANLAGLRVHREFSPDIYLPGIGTFDLTDTYTPPIKTLDPIFSVGNVTQVNGSDFGLWSDGDSFVLSYNVTTLVAAYENVTVPFGTFPAAKVQTSFYLFGTIGSTPISDTSTFQNWLSPGLGIIRQEHIADGETTIKELIATNRQYAPEPAGASSAAAVLLSLRMLVGYRRGALG